MVVGVIDGMALTVNTLDEEGLPPLPTSYKDSQNGGYAKEWRNAAIHEMKAKWANETGTLVTRPYKTNVVKSKLVPSYKRNEDGSIKERRWRWVGCGYSQREGVDYFATFTATAKAGSVRYLLGYIAHRRMSACTVDIVKAFTTSEVRETLYVEQPEGFVEGGYEQNGKPKLVYLLKKGLEGLKQSGHNFQQDNTKHLTKACGMTQLVTEPCMFVKWTNNKLLIILMYIDDLLIGYDEEGDLNEFLKLYRARYKIEHKPLSGFIGLQITRDPDLGTITLSQEKYIRRMGEKYLGPGDLIRDTKLPCACDKRSTAGGAYADLSLAASEEERATMSSKPYLSLLATILYASCMTRPDVAYHVSYLSRFASDPSPACYKALLTVCNYLVTTAKLCVTLGGKIKPIEAESMRPAVDMNKLIDSIGLHSWSDGSWKVDSNYAGYVVMAFNGPIEWGSKLIKLTMHSSSEIEIAAACLAGKRLMFFREMSNEIGVKLSTPIPMMIDNSGAIDMCEKLGVSKKTEHFMRWQHYSRYLVKQCIVKMHFVRSHEQLADQLTKMGDKTGFLRTREMLLGKEEEPVTPTGQGVTVLPPPRPVKNKSYKES